MSATTAYSDEVVCVPRAGTLYDVLELILDRGMVIDVFIRVSLVGIEILKIDARIVVASVDTYLRFAEACNRLDLESDSRSRTLPQLFGGDDGGGVGEPGEYAYAEEDGGGSPRDDGRGDDERGSRGRSAAHSRQRSSSSRSSGSRSGSTHHAREG